MPDTHHGDRRRSRRVNTRWIRLTLCLVLLAGATAATAVSSLTNQLRVCKASSADHGDATCRPLTLTDAPVALAVATALFLVLPDVKRLGVRGLFDIETRDTPPHRPRRRRLPKRSH